MLYPNGSDLPLGHLIMHTNPFASGIPWTPSPSLIAKQISLSHGAHVLLEAKQTRCCLGHLLNGLYSNTICSKSGSQSLMPRCCVYAQPQAQCQLFDAPNASSHLISSHLISPTLEVPFSYAL